MALFTTKALMAQAKKTGRTMHTLHVDLSKAYNRVSRKRLWTILFKSGVKGKLWLALMSTYSKSSEYIKLRSRPWTELDLINGLRQGSVLSPLLFIISMDALLEALQKTGTGFPVGNITIPGLAYVDDLQLIAMSEEELHIQLHTLLNFSHTSGLIVNTDKTFCLSTLPWDALKSV